MNTTNKISGECIKLIFNVTLLICILTSIRFKFWGIDSDDHQDYNRISSVDIAAQYRDLITGDVRNIELVNQFKHLNNANVRLLNYLIFVSSLTNDTIVSLLNKNVKPNTFHSHNDYTRKIPLFEALSLGLTSIEADVWLTNKNKNLSVAHKQSDLRNAPIRDFNELYLRPLLVMLDDVNMPGGDENEPISGRKGLYQESKNRTMFLVIDFKSDDSTRSYKTLMDFYLKPFIEKDYLTSFDISSNEMSWRPITIILTGNKPTDIGIIDKDSDINGIGYLGNNKRYVFPEKMLDNLASLNESSKSFMASASFGQLCKACGTSPWKVILNGELPPETLICFKKFISDAHSKNLKTRIWGIPKIPRKFSKNFWRQQIDDLGVDFINVDHITKSLTIMNYDRY